MMTLKEQLHRNDGLTWKEIFSYLEAMGYYTLDIEDARQELEEAEEIT